jgi:hypothetical protein
VPFSRAPGPPVAPPPPQAPPKVVPPAPAAPAPESLPAIPGAVTAAAWPDAGEDLWFVYSGRLFRRLTAEGKEVQELPFTRAETPSAPWALRVLTDAGSPTRVGLSVAGQGAWYAPKGKEFQPSGALEGYPLSEREGRFIKAPWDPDGEAYDLLDFQGKELAHFLQLARIRSDPGESLLVLRKKDGTLCAFRGNSLEPIPAPAEGGFSALAGWQDRVAVSESDPPHRVRTFRRSGDSWEEVWSSGPLPRAASALCLGRTPGGEAALAFLPGSGETAVLLLRPPPPAPSPGSRVPSL